MARSFGRRGSLRRPTGGTVTYSVNGRQYIAIPAGGGGINAAAILMTPEVDAVSGGNAVYVFALPQ